MSDESHSGMSMSDAIVKALIAKHGSVAAALVAAETMHRSDAWVFIAYDADDLERPVHVTGIFPDEHAAFLAGAEYERWWAAHNPASEEGVVTKAVPLFIEEGRTHGT